MAEKILITGISGFIGRHVAEHAITQGYEVSGIDVKECPIKGVNFTNASILDMDAVSKVMKGMDYVIHLAAITSNVEFEKEPAKCYAINVNGFMNVLEAAASNGCKRFLYASSAAVYTNESGFSESAVIDIKKQRNHYAKSKLMNEMLADSYRDIKNMNTIGMRFFNVFGQGENDKGDYASIMSLFIRENKAGRPLVIYGDGTQARDFIFADDVSQIILSLLENGRESLYNVGTGKATKYEDIANIINKGNKKYVSNPLSSYQYLTQANTKRLLEAIHEFKFTSVDQGIKKISGQE